MNAPVLQQRLQRLLRHVPSNRIESGEYNRPRSFINNNLHPRKLLNGFNIPALLANDAALHIVGRQINDAGGSVNGVRRGDALHY